jgi:hypothetical protein
MIAARERRRKGAASAVSPPLPEPLRSQLVEALAQLVVADLEKFPTLPGDQQAEAHARPPR